MKQKLTPIALALAILLGGCGQQQSQNMEYIGAQQAKTLALQDAGLSADSVTFSDVVLDKRDGLDYYAVEFASTGREYEYDIDALTGTVIDSRSTGDESSPASQATAQSSAAQAAAQPSSPAASQPPSRAASQAARAGAAVISVEDAKARALRHAGLSAGQVSFVTAKLEQDDGQQIYDVEFYTSEPKEYDYEIDAYTGDVISYDFDADSYTAPPASGTSITADKAKELALAQVPGAAAGDIREFETDYDDGRLAYEGTIVYDGLEYEFEIDGYSGAIRSWESEPVERRTR